MPKKRPPTWQRGAPKPATTDPRPIRAETSATADVDLGSTTTIESTWDPAQAHRADFRQIQPPQEDRRLARSHITSGWASVIIAAILVIGGAFWYVARMNADVAVNSAKIDALQKAQDTWTLNLREDIKRLETSMSTRLTEMSRFVDVIAGRAPTTTKKP